MLFRKKEKKPVKNTKPYVCKTCGCLVARNRVRTIEKLYSSYTDYLHYCAVCKPPYDKINYNINSIRYFIRTPEHYEEVTEEGKSIKKKK